MKRILFIILIGVVIIGSATASTLVEIKCGHCGGDGKQECLECEGAGGFIFPVIVECGCRGNNPDCPICGGRSAYISFGRGACLACGGGGGELCPYCDGRGEMRANEKILKVLRLK